jgi:hypothetical protein
MSDAGALRDLRVEAARLVEGRWQAVLAGAPDANVAGLSLRCDGVAIDPPEIVAVVPGHWHLVARLPAALIGDGVRTVALVDGSGGTLGSFVVIGGAPVEGDLRAEVELLRAELDLLKRAFRRHCAETEG